MGVSRAEIVEKNVLDRLEQWLERPAAEPLEPEAPIAPGNPLDVRTAVVLFEAMVTSRALDLEARALKQRDIGYYTIASCGHEGNAVLGEVLRATDPCFLHYRSGALMMARARKASGAMPIRETIQGLLASSDDPAAGGRHKVWASKGLWVPPQTSTIASHLPKAVGVAFALERARHLEFSLPIPEDSIVVATFGDASINHNVALSGFNTVGWASFQRLPVPILFVCEDNGIGISVRTPQGWVATSLRAKPGLRYFGADGLDLADAYRAAREAAEFVRVVRAPAVLHLRTVRLLGHAGSDVETEYRSVPDIEAVERQDPLLAAIDLLVGSGALPAGEALRIVRETRETVRREAEALRGSPRLETLAQVVAPLAPYRPNLVEAEASSVAGIEAREAAFGGPERLPERQSKPRPLATLLNWGLADALARYPDLFLFGEDVAKKGGVYHVTAQLWERFGAARVFNTLLDETSILGLAIGAGHLGLLPVPEIQYLAYVHNAEDQLRGEACSLQWFSNGQFSNPMVVRIASFAYQRGFGGHFHNDNAIGALRDIPGLVIAAPSRGDDAVSMLRTCLALAKVDGRVVAFLEPIALYHEKDLHAPGDGGWLCRYPPAGEVARLGEPRLWIDGDGSDDRDLLIVSYANGLRLSLVAARRLRDRGIRARVLDLRWLAPLPHREIAEQARLCGAVLVVDECRRTGGGVAEAILAALAENDETRALRTARHTAADTYIPLGPAAQLCLPSAESIESAAIALLSRSEPAPEPLRPEGAETYPSRRA